MKLHGRQGRGSSSWLCFTLLNPRTTTTLPLDFVAAARASGGWAGVSAADPQSPRSRKPAMRPWSGSCRRHCSCSRLTSERRTTANPDAWRAALRVFEHASGRAPEQVDEPGAKPDSAERMAALTWARLQQLAVLHLAEPANGHDPPPGDAVEAPGPDLGGRLGGRRCGAEYCEARYIRG
jgi:hypothetical protein